METIFKADFLHEFSKNFWMFHIAITVVAALLIIWLETLIFRHLHPRLSKTFRIWDDSLITALHRPFMVLISILAVTVIIQDIVQHFYGQYYLKDLHLTYQLITILFIVWFCVRFISNLQKEMNLQINLGKRNADKTTVGAISQIARTTTLVIAVLILLQTFGISISALLAFGGIGGLAVGFAAKDTLANFLGGLMIYIDRPFAVGDWIRSPDREIEGTVEHIGWRLTRIRTLDRRPLYIPNGIFSMISVENPSRMTHRRLRAYIGLRYEDAPKIRLILKDVESMLKNHPEVDTEKTLMVNLTELADSSLNFMVYAFIKATEQEQFQNAQQDIFLKIIDIITQHGAQCAFPSRTLYIPERIHVANSK